MGTLLYEGILAQVIKGKVNYDEAIKKQWNILSLLLSLFELNN